MAGSLATKRTQWLATSFTESGTCNTAAQPDDGRSEGRGGEGSKGQGQPPREWASHLDGGQPEGVAAPSGLLGAAAPRHVHLAPHLVRHRLAALVQQGQAQARHCSGGGRAKGDEAGQGHTPAGCCAGKPIGAASAQPAAAIQPLDHAPTHQSCWQASPPAPPPAAARPPPPPPWSAGARRPATAAGRRGGWKPPLPAGACMERGSMLLHAYTALQGGAQRA
jgi:hypothetical protein